VQVVVATTGSSIPLVKAGQVRALAVAGTTRPGGLAVEGA
jgi:tripartite-type tricarboxylate transporter receptor subunit TctC